MDFLFGEGQYGLRFLFAFIVVLALIGLTAWLVRRFGAERLGATAARGRQPRLAVIDAAAVDGRRRLILIRRDNVEHLLMIGGPSDIVIEPNIVRATAAPRDAVPLRTPVAEAMPRPAPLAESGWPLQPESPRGPRPAPVAEETMQWPAEPELPRQNRAPDPLASAAAELTRNPPEPIAPPAPRPVRERAPMREREVTRDQEPARERTPTREREVSRDQEPARERTPTREREVTRDQEPARAPQPAAEAPFASAADQNLAEMAQRLEAALRRPGKSEVRAEPIPQAPPPAEKEAMPPETKQAQSAPKPAREANKPAREAKPAAPPKTLYDNLEQEMASLLGRPNKKS